MSEIVGWTAPHYKVLVVAVKHIEGRNRDTNELIYSWQALIKNVPGQNHGNEIESVKAYGTPVTESRARAFFPHIDTRLGGKHPYKF